MRLKTPGWLRTCGKLVLGMGSWLVSGLAIAVASTPALRAVDRHEHPAIYVWTDTGNVYVLRDGDTAVLIDLGDGTVLDQLGRIGVTQVDWVLFTHHHREQCQGAARLEPWRARGTRVGAPEAERALFERPTDFRKMNVSLGDPFTIHGASYVRPPIRPIRLDRVFGTNDSLPWRGSELACLATPGNSPGALSYCLRRGDRTVVFSGDLVLAGAKLHTWFDSEWDYGFAAGIRALRQSTAALAALDPALLLPSHGPTIRRPAATLRQYAAKLERLQGLYLRGYDVEGGSQAYQDKVSRPTVVSNVWQITPHLFKFKRPSFWGNFGLILADSGRALVVDCGLLDETMLDDALAGMRTHYGLRAIDALIVTHMHGDHFLQAPHLRETWGVPVWALDTMVDPMEHPEWFDYAAPIQAYGQKLPDGSRLTGVRVDRAFKPGETFDWEGYRFTVDWMPGQTKFALCLHAMIDGSKVAFTGDNLFADPENPRQTGHEAVVAHNSAIFEEGYIYGAEFLKRLAPDLLVGGHSFVMDQPAGLIERFRAWSHQMRDAFRRLSAEPDYRYGYDPYWVRAQPYRAALPQGGSVEVSVHLRNFLSSRQAHRIEIHLPPGLAAEPPVWTGTVAGGGQTRIPVRIRAAPDAPAGVRLVALDVTRDRRRYGEWFDVILEVRARNQDR